MLARASMIVLLLAPLGALAEGFSYVKQLIYGMDCAPCAYGVEQGLKRLPGVQTVTVSLNEGFAELTLREGSAVTLEDIRAVIMKNGFTPRSAYVRLSGTIACPDRGALSLQVGGRRISLHSPDEALRRRLAARTGRPVTVEGVLAAGAEQPLHVESIIAD